MPNDPIQAIEFAQSKGQARKDGRTNVSFADVAGCDEAVRELKFVVEVSNFSWSERDHDVLVLLDSSRFGEQAL